MPTLEELRVRINSHLLVGLERLLEGIINVEHPIENKEIIVSEELQVLIELLSGILFIVDWNGGCDVQFVASM